MNQRALMQEVHQDQTLHKLLGVKRKPPIIIVDSDDDHDQKAARPESRSKTTRPVNPLEQHDHSSADEAPSPTRHRRQDDDNDDDRGRYDIGSSRSGHKRRRVGKEERDTHTVFTTDDDDDESDIHHRGDVEGSRDVYGSSGSSRRRPKIDRKFSREYWLNKGVSSSG